MRIHGACHCGNLRFSLTWNPDPVQIAARACTCSFCVKHGGVWTSCPDGKLTIEIADPAAISSYEFETRVVQFHICTRCGVVPVASRRIEDRLYAVVNVNTFEDIAPGLIQRSPSNVGGEDTATRLARQQRNWIGQVEIIERGGR